MLRAVAALFALCFLASCVSPPPRDRGEAPLQSPGSSSPEARPAAPKEIPQADAPPAVIPSRGEYATIARSAVRSLPAGSVVPDSAGEPTLVVMRVDGGRAVGVIGLALEAEQAVLWNGRLDTDRAVQMEQVEVIAPAKEIRGFSPLSVSSAGPHGFSALLVNAEREVRVVGLLSNEEAYMIAAPQSPTQMTEVRDIDRDGTTELLQYSLVFEAPSNREVVLDIFEWDQDAFVLTASVPILRQVNRFLDSVEEALMDGGDGLMDTIERSAVVVEGPPLTSLLPAERVTVPRLNEVPVDIARGPWEFPFEFLVETGDRTGVYRIVIVLPDNPATDDVRIRG